jgi:anion-transporting  ArsA/GET3 family ATPase
MTALLDDRRIVVCVGTGGVGKTTVSSAIAIAAAQRGRRALVLTIDPARRLADALGLPELGSAPERISPDRERAYGIDGDGALSAMMLDMKGTFDELVERLCPDLETRARILGNPLYQHISDALAGSVEYAAMEKVHELSHSDAFDLIVVDTPPAQHALDFLDAPERLVTLLDSSLVRLLVQPAFSAGRLGFRLFSSAAERTLGFIARLSGVSFLKEISELLLSIESLSEGFKDRARAVQSLLRGSGTAFLLVASPSPATASQAFELIAGLESSGIDLAGVLVNRVHGHPDAATAASESEATSTVAFATPDGEARTHAASIASALARRLAAVGVDRPEEAARAALAVTEEYALQVEADQRQTEAIRRASARGGHFVSTLPAVLDRGDEAGALRQLASALTSAPPESPLLSSESLLRGPTS